MRADDVLEALFIRVWTWCRKHWMVACLAPWIFLTATALAEGRLLAAAVHLAVATAIFYGMAKAEAIEKANNPKG